MLMQNQQAFEHAETATNAARLGHSLASLFDLSPIETVPAGKALCWEGDAAKHLFQVVEGVVRLQRIIGEGRRVITAFHFAGDLIGAFLQGDFLFTAEAVTDCKIRRVARKTFQENVAKCDALRPEYIALLCHETAAAHEQMVLLSKKNAEERLCSFIVELARRPGGQPRQGLLRVPMNRQDIADYLGLTIETVSRTMTQLECAGTIALPTSRHVLVKRRQELARLSAC